MSTAELTTLLAKTLEDSRLSRGERQALRAVWTSEKRDETDRRDLRKQAFALAKKALQNVQDGQLLDWLDDIIQMLDQPSVATQAVTMSAFFSPRDDCARQLMSIIGRVKQTLDICVFTITDDRITNAILEAHLRSVSIRILTDDDKAADLGSDIVRLRDAGIPVRYDRSPAHMHHKFALFDRQYLLNGSYNWTRGASTINRENFILLEDHKLVSAFQQEFDRLWAEFASRL